MSYHSQTLTWKIIPKLTILFLLIITSFIYSIYWFIPVFTRNTDKEVEKPTPQSVYPCVYREHLGACSFSIVISGLSLCIQGTQYSAIHYDVAVRFIPVYTGKTFFNRLYKPTTPVYPCVYREHSRLYFASSALVGLSLCIQGTHQANQI